MECLILRNIKDLRKEEGNFTVKRIMERSGLKRSQVLCRTVQHLLRSNGYRYVNARQKGLLSNADFTKHLQFAKMVKRDYSDDLWTEKIAFYLDGVSFIQQIKCTRQEERSGENLKRV